MTAPMVRAMVKGDRLRAPSSKTGPGGDADAVVAVAGAAGKRALLAVHCLARLVGSHTGGDTRRTHTPRNIPSFDLMLFLLTVIFI